MKVKKLLTNYIATPSDAVRVEVPKTIGGYPVTGLEKTFYENQTIETIALPEGIRFLGKIHLTIAKLCQRSIFPLHWKKSGSTAFIILALKK